MVGRLPVLAEALFRLVTLSRPSLRHGYADVSAALVLDALYRRRAL